MSDKKEEDDKEIVSEEKPKKQLKGFALPQNRKNISKRGRPVGSKNKVPSEADWTKAVLERSVEAVEAVNRIMKNGSDANVLKAAFKIMDTSVDILKNGGKLSITKTTKDTKETYEVDEDDMKKTGTDGNVFKFITTKFVEEEDKE